MDCFIDPIKKLSEYTQWEKAVLSKRGENTFTGLSGSMKAHFAYLFSERTKIVYVAANDLAAAKAYGDFSFLCGDGAVLLPSREDMLYLSLIHISSAFSDSSTRSFICLTSTGNYYNF